MDNQDKDLFGQTPWQTVGPFFHYGLPWKGGADLTGTCVRVAQVCAQIYQPVCGCDGQTYSNSCVAAGRGANVASSGACPSATN